MEKIDASMKVFFSYQDGFVNIDDDYLYFTSTGVWSEAYALNEKTVESPKQTITLKKKLIQLIWLLVFPLILIFVMYHISDEIELTYLTLVHLFLSFLYGIYTIFFKKAEKQTSFKVSKEKLIQVSVRANKASVIFINGDNIEEKKLLKKMNKKGILLMGALQEQKG